MKRLQRTQQLLAKLCAEQGRGYDAAELAMQVGALRHNVSADLNELWRDGLVVKENGRPVRYWDKQVYQRLHGGEPGPAAAPGSQADSANPPLSSDPLMQTIGAMESLRRQVEQAKAAVLYPPHGLHTLLVGPTGVGKSRMAELMHGFGVAVGKFKPDAPFVTLNCADYAANPQLLMAHLFGATKGAYTGADREREGLVDQADGGILFLDEVHRLPAEGQEMLFRLIDKGLYRRLGDTGPERHATVMLVAATTERIDSALLKTFTRRIPMMITMPSLSERTAGERLKFIRLFLQAEAGKIGVDIVVSQETLRMLLEYECLGNIGQLRNDIQLACARLFLSYLAQRREPMELLPVHLPEHIHRTVPPVRHRNPDVTELLRTIGARLVIGKRASAQQSLMAGLEPDEGPLSFYGLIERQMAELKRQGLSPADAEGRVQQNIETHFKDFVEQVRQRHQVQRQELSKIVGTEILRATERAVVFAEDRLGRAIPERILYALALHVHATLERVQQGHMQDYLSRLPVENTDEARVATEMVHLLGRELGYALPNSDVAFVTMLLRPESDEAPPESQVGVAVVAHGRGVASGMVDVAHQLAGVSLGVGIDMPLDEEPAVVEDELVRLAQEGRFPGGLLLLVDMGSLEAMGQAVNERAGIQVRTISMVSPPVVVEAVHQASIPGATLDQVYQAVLMGRGLLLGHDSTEEFSQVIVTFCFTGVGSANTLAKIVKEALEEQARRVDIIPASIGAGTGWARLIATLLQNHRLLATVGPINPRIPGIPFVSTEEVVVGKGGRRLRQLVEEALCLRPDATPPQEPEVTLGDGHSPLSQEERAALFAQMAHSLGEHLKVTNPAATVPVIAKGLNSVEQYLGRPLSDELRVGLMMHLVCLVERKVRDRLMRESAPDEQIDRDERIPWLPEALQEVTSMFHIQFNRQEMSHLGDIITESVSALS